jgi:DnaK suppressor protein
MPVKKPSAKATKAKKTVSAKPRPAAKAAAKPSSKPKTPARAIESTPARRPAASRPAAARPAARPSTPAAEETRPEAGASLLAGPRNVQPYVSRKGEEYMSKEQLEHFRTILSTWKQDLMQEVDRTMLHMKDEAANFPDPNDRATQESEFSLELRTRDRERKLIRKIDEALKRIEDGSYGYCLETGEPIGVKRLEARPVATLSVEAQERRERREKQFGDRDDWYR